MPGWLRNPVGALLLVALLLGCLTTTTLASEIGHPFGGYVSALLFESDRTVIVAETPGWWPIYQTGLASKDGLDVRAINDRSHRRAAAPVFAEARITGDTSVTLHIWDKNAARTFTVRVPVLTFEFIHFLEVKLPDLIVGLSFWLTAVVVLKARPSAPLNRVFAIATALIAAHRWSAIHLIWMDERLFPTVLTAVYLVVGGLVQPALLHFAMLFPKPVSPWPRPLVPLIWIIGTASGLIMAMSRILLAVGWNDPARFAVSNVAYNVMLVVYLIALLALFGRLASLWLSRRHSRRERRMGLLVLLSLMVSLPVLLTFAGAILPGIGEDQSRFLFGLDLRYLLLAIPLALAFIIVRYQSMRSPSRLLVVVFALAGSALLASVLSWLWGLVQGDWPASGEHPPFPYLFVGIFAASLFWATQANWRGWFGRLLDWDTQSYAATREFGRRVAGTTSLDTLAQTMALALVDELQLARAAVWFWRSGTATFELAAEAGETAGPLPTSLFSGPTPLPLSRPLRLDLSDETPAWLESLRAAQAIDVVVPLSGDDQLVGLLGFGHRWDEEVFDDRDLVIAELVGQQAALFVLAAMQVDELRAVPQRVVMAQENERRRLAAELHDTVQQFLGGLPFALSFTPEQIRRYPEGVVDALETCLTDVESMADTVRRIRFNLAPSRLEQSLVSSVRDLTEYVTRRSGLPVTLTIGEGVDAATTLAAREALYRVIQQALDNVVTHGRATAAEIRLECVAERVTVRIADNGRGSSEAERQDAIARHRFGLVSMRARLELCGGGFKFRSVPGMGTTVAGWVPVSPAPVDDINK